MIGSKALPLSLGSHSARSWQVKQAVSELSIYLTGFPPGEAVMFSTVRNLWETIDSPVCGGGGIEIQKQYSYFSLAILLNNTMS